MLELTILLNATLWEVHSKSMDIYYSNLTGHPSAAIPQIIVPITKDM